VSDDPDSTDSTAKAAKRVSMRKPASAGDTGAAPKASRPRHVQGAVAAIGASAVAAIIAATALYGERDWLTSEQKKANAKTIARAVKDATKKATDAHKSASDIAAAAVKAEKDTREKFPNLHNQVSQQQSGALIGTLIVVAALAVLGFSVYRGRYWARWGVVAFWFLASFTGTVVGVGTVLSVGSSVPAGFKVPAFLAGAFLIVAVVLVNFRASTEYFALTKPVRSSDLPARRGLFTPRTPPQGGRTPAADRSKAGVLKSSAATRGEAYVERQRSKKRAAANQESVARGAELARSRAKASKSRRIER
jgi:hypothetical protein